MTPLVLLHAFPLSARMYDDLVAMVDSPVLVPDLPGFGRAELSAAEPSLDVFADFVIEQLDAAGLGRAVVAGTSMGGYTAMAIWRRHPERVAALGLIDTKATDDTADAAEGRRQMAVTMEEQRSTDPLTTHVLPKLLGSTTFSSRPEVVRTVTEWVAAGDPRAAAWAQRAMAGRPDSFDTLRSVDVPSTVVVGAEDVLSPPSDAEAMVSALPDAALVVVPEAGHLTPVESPARVASALEGLRARVDG